MDAKQLKEAREKLGKLEREISELTLKLRSTESRLNAEHESLRRLVSQRTGTIAQLADATTEAAQKINKDVDKFDAEIRATERSAESLQSLVKTINSTMAELKKEHDAIGLQVAAEVNAQEFESWKVQLQQARADLENAFAEARLKLAGLDSLCATGGERFKGQAFSIAAAVFEELLHKEANCEQNGWRVSTPAYRPNAGVYIRALVRR